MATPTTPWYDRIVEVLADGEWHRREELIQAAIPLVPPGQAHRAAEKDRVRRSQSPTRVRGDQATAIAAGARRLVDEALRGLVRYGRVWRDGDRYQLVEVVR